VGDVYQRLWPHWWRDAASREAQPEARVSTLERGGLKIAALQLVRLREPYPYARILRVRRAIMIERAVETGGLVGFI
jgi:hypothetical protein